MIKFYDWFYRSCWCCCCFSPSIFASSEQHYSSWNVFHSSHLTRNKCRSTSIKKSATLKSHNKAILKFDAQVLRDERARERQRMWCEKYTSSANLMRVERQVLLVVSQVFFSRALEIAILSFCWASYSIHGSRLLHKTFHGVKLFIWFNIINGKIITLALAWEESRGQKRFWIWKQFRKFFISLFFETS